MDTQTSALGQALHTRRIPQTYSQLLFDYLEARGVVAEQVLNRPRPAADPHGLASLLISDWAALLARASGHLNDPLLGLHLGQTIAPRHLGVLGYVILACDNLGAAMMRLEQYQRLVFDYVPMRLRPGRDYVDLVWGMTDELPGVLVDETGISALVQFCRSLTAPSLAPLQVGFVNPPPKDIRPYEAYFGCPVHFGGQETVVRVSQDMLAMPLASADPGLIAVMEQQADALLARMPQVEPVVAQVRKLTARLLHDGEPDIQAVAAQLHCAPRTLQRRLSVARTTYRQELARVRRELADNYLSDPRLSIADIALLLGYSEHSAFTRGYKEWTGRTPQQQRAAPVTV